jgi:WS/DGAT/MGAT family acyltransferase
VESPLYQPLSAQDASFLFFEHRATHMHVAALAIFEVGPLRSETGGVDAARLARYGESQLGTLRATPEVGVHAARAAVFDDARFDLEYHVRHTALPPPGGVDQLERLVGRVLSQPLDRDRPLWEMWLVEGLERDRFALLIKVHHCMVDGVAGASLLTTLFRAEPDASIPRPLHGCHAARLPLRLVLEEAIDWASTPLTLAHAAGEALREPGRTLGRARERTASVAEALRGALHLPSTTGLERPIGPHRRVEWGIFDLAEIKGVGRQLGGKVNDVVLAIVTGAMRRFLERRGEPLQAIDYRVVVPVNMRSASEEPGVANRDSAFFLSLPVAESNPRARFDAVRTETARLKRSHAAEGIDFLGQLIDRTGSTWLIGLFARIALRVQPYNQIVSNVPGPQFPLYVLGARLLELYPMPPLFERQGLGTAVMSYDGRLCWCILADRDVVPDLDVLAHDVDAAFHEFRGAAGRVGLPRTFGRDAGAP